MTHYHEVYFNAHTSDGPRVGATRRTKIEIARERIAARRVGRYVHPGAEIVRCDRPDEECPWTRDGVPVAAQSCDGFDVTDAQADRIGKLRARNDVTLVGRDTNAVLIARIKDHGSNTVDTYRIDPDGRLDRVLRIR